MAEIHQQEGGVDARTDHRILLIGQDSADAATVQTALAEVGGWDYSVEWVRHLSEGIARLAAGPTDAVLLDLFLPDCQGLEAFERLCLAAPHIPVLILCNQADESLAIQAVERGAQDYLLRTHLDSHALRHALRSMIERRTVADALFVERERADVTLNSIGDAVLSTDISGRVTFLNVAAEDMLGWTRQDAVGRPLTEIFHIVDGETHELAPNPLALAIQENKTVGLTANCILVRRDGREVAIEDSASPIHERQGGVTGAVIVFRDVSRARAMSLQMSHLARHDALTNLPNRLLLSDRLTGAIASARRYRRQLGVMFLDLDRFKHINDSPVLSTTV